MNTHTPGPWRFLPFDNVIVYDAYDCGAQEIAWSDADYRLIAAAPELLAALKAMAACDDDRGWGDVLAQALAAIAKAQQNRSAIAKAEGREVPS